MEFICFGAPVPHRRSPAADHFFSNHGEFLLQAEPRKSLSLSVGQAFLPDVGLEMPTSVGAVPSANVVGQAFLGDVRLELLT
jgi:hypothetical protein